MRLIPMRDKVVIKPIKSTNITKSGIVLPDSNSQPTTGTILAIGKTDNLCDISIGDLVLFGKYTGMPIVVQDESFIIMKIDEVIAVLN